MGSLDQHRDKLSIERTDENPRIRNLRYVKDYVATKRQRLKRPRRRPLTTESSSPPRQVDSDKVCSSTSHACCDDNFAQHQQPATAKSEIANPNGNAQVKFQHAYSRSSCKPALKTPNTTGKSEHESCAKTPTAFFASLSSTSNNTQANKHRTQLRSADHRNRGITTRWNVLYCHTV